jgi:hypothetical protein
VEEKEAEFVTSIETGMLGGVVLVEDDRGRLTLHLFSVGPAPTADTTAST